MIGEGKPILEKKDQSELLWQNEVKKYVSYICHSSSKENKETAMQ